MLVEKLDSFAAAPFTIQRISELLSDPRKQYSRIDKFMRAVEKTILVVSTVPPGRHRSESENGDSLDSALNGDFSTEVNVDIDMEHDGSFTKELSATANRKEPNHEASSSETITIKKNVSPVKEEVAGTSESAVEKSVKEEVKEPAVEVAAPKVESAAAVVEPKITPEAEPAIKEEPVNTSPQASSGEQPDKADTPIIQPVETVVVSKPAVDEALLHEPIRPAENEILIDTTDIISQTTPLAALENIVAVRTEPIAEVLDQVEPKSVAPIDAPEPETNETRDEVIVQASAASPVKDESATEPKRLKISEELQRDTEKIEAVHVEQPVPEVAKKPIDELVATPAVTEVTVEEQIQSVPVVEAAAEIIPAVVEPVVEEKIDEPIPEIAEIPIETVPASEDIAETPTTDMETVSTIPENKMSLDEDEPPAIELEMTPIGNKMDTDEAEAAPMDFEDSSNEPMDQ